MRVTILGPNLPRPLCDKGDMHVHAAGCADVRRYPKGADQGGWEIDADTMQDVVEAVYGDMIDESGRAWHEYIGDLHWAPCVDSLPEVEGDAEVALGWTFHFEVAPEYVEDVKRLIDEAMNTFAGEGFEPYVTEVSY